MNAITGIVRNVNIVLDNPADLPEGCRVLVEPMAEEDAFGIHEEDWQDTPEAIAAWLRCYDTLEPLAPESRVRGTRREVAKDMGVNRYLLDTGVMGDFINHRKGVDVKVREARHRMDCPRKHERYGDNGLAHA